MTTTIRRAVTVPAGPAAADPRYWDCPELNTEQHIAASLGEPIELPDWLAEAISNDWATEHDDDLADHFAMLTGGRYEQFHRDNTYNSEQNLSSQFVFSIWAPADCSDWCWCNDVFVVIETHLGGDVRGNYSGAKVYRVDCIAETGFLDWVVGWYASHIRQVELFDELYELAEINSRLAIGYSSNPTCQLRDLLMPGTEPAWSDRLGCYVARLADVPFAVRLEPTAPYYGG